MGQLKIVPQYCSALIAESEQGSRLPWLTWEPRGIQEWPGTETAEQTAPQVYFWMADYKEQRWHSEGQQCRVAAKRENHSTLHSRFGSHRFDKLAPWRLGLRKKELKETEVVLRRDCPKQIDYRLGEADPGVSFVFQNYRWCKSAHRLRETGRVSASGYLLESL